MIGCMKRIIILGIGIILIALIAGMVTLNAQKKASSVPQIVTTTTAPMIQIITGPVFLVTAQGTVIRELIDGEELSVPARLKLGANADATILYMDGSSARLSSGTEIELIQGLYDTKTDTISSKIFVYVGHVWSKVTELATPQSSWQVVTPHAVATVRGTAFDTAVENGTSAFIGSEHTVAIVPIDPDTGKEMTEKAADLNENKEIVLTDNDMDEIKDNKEKIEVKEFDSKKSSHKDWMEKNIKRDRILEDIKKQGGDRKSLRDKLLESDNEVEDTVSEQPKSVEKKPEPIVENPKPVVPVIVEEPKVMAATTEHVVIRINLPKTLVEGTEIPYSVIAISNTGSEQDITQDAKVQVLGGIGKIRKQGTFFADIDTDKKELGTVPGGLNGTWIDAITGKKFEFSTPVFEVNLFIEPTTDRRG